MTRDAVSSHGHVTSPHWSLSVAVCWQARFSHADKSEECKDTLGLISPDSVHWSYVGDRTQDMFPLQMVTTHGSLIRAGAGQGDRGQHKGGAPHLATGALCSCHWQWSLGHRKTMMEKWKMTHQLYEQYDYALLSSHSFIVKLYDSCICQSLSRPASQCPLHQGEC